MRQPSRFEVIMKKIWPGLNRILTSIFYFVINVIRTVVKVAIEQIKGSI